MSDGYSVSKLKSIKTTLVIWFLLISLVPLNIVLWVGYEKSKETFYNNIVSELSHTLPLKVNFFNNWFEYRIVEVNNWSNTHKTNEFMKELSHGLISSKNTDTYISSDGYKSIIKKYETDYLKIFSTYDYLYDLFLIDINGNILYSVAKAGDLGVNLNSKKMTSTLFAKTFRKTLSDKSTHFSDFERYESSNNEIVGFFTVPILDENRKMIGVFATQIVSDKITNNIQVNTTKKENIKTYLVGIDGKLRSKIDKDDDNSEVLIRSINTDEIKHFLSHFKLSKINEIHVNKYIGPDGNTVIGAHEGLEILGTKWILISEIDERAFLVSMEELVRNISLIMTISTLFIVFIALIIAGYITKPILKLSKASTLIAQGSKKEPVKIEVQNEIGQLAFSFNNMLKKIQQNEIQLIQQSQLAQMGEMISMIAHQWRQPLSAISSAVIDLKMKINLNAFEIEENDNTKQYQKYFLNSFDNIESFVKTLSNTIDDFRNFHKPNKDKNSVVIDIPIKKALKIVRASLESNNIEIVESYKSKKEVKIYEHEIMQVALNIFKNALDNFKEKESENKKVSITTKDIENGVYIEISDNGGGIKDEIIDKIFDPYFSTKNSKNGTGLGLYMSKTIIEIHHKGKLGVRNVDNGVCFFIEISS